MKHTDIDVVAVARMAKLELSKEEREHYHSELLALVDFCSNLSVFDGEKSAARSVFVPLEQLRDDEPLEEDTGNCNSDNTGKCISLPVRVVADEV